MASENDSSEYTLILEDPVEEGQAEDSSALPALYGTEKTTTPDEETLTTLRKEKETLRLAVQEEAIPPNEAFSLNRAIDEKIQNLENPSSPEALLSHAPAPFHMQAPIHSDPKGTEEALDSIVEEQMAIREQVANKTLSEEDARIRLNHLNDQYKSLTVTPEPDSDIVSTTTITSKGFSPERLVHEESAYTLHRKITVPSDPNSTGRNVDLPVQLYISGSTESTAQETLSNTFAGAVSDIVKEGTGSDLAASAARQAASTVGTLKGLTDPDSTTTVGVKFGIKF